MDLTQRPPRSPRIRLGGYVILPRILDKGRAATAGKLGAYKFAGKGMDRHFFAFTGITFEEFRAELSLGRSDSEMLAWIAARAKNAEPWTIAAWSAYHEQRGPDSDAETLEVFREMLGRFTTTREDIRTWFDLLDVDDHCSFGGQP